MPAKLKPEERDAELAAMVRGLRRFFSQQNRRPVFPELGGITGKAMYGECDTSGSLGFTLLEMVCHEINSCSHIRSPQNPQSRWMPKPPKGVRSHFVDKYGQEEGREDPDAFEDFASTLLPTGTAASMQPTQAAGAGPATASSELVPMCSQAAATRRATRRAAARTMVRRWTQAVACR